MEYDSWELPIIINIGDGDSWSWKQMQLVLHPDQPEKLFYRHGQGCSCDSITDRDLKELNEQTWKDFANIAEDYADPATVTEFLLQALREMRLDPYERLNRLQAKGILT